MRPPSAVRRVAVADIQGFEIGHGLLAGDALAVGPTIQGPVVEHREVAISGWMHVEFDPVGAEVKGGPHRWEGVLQEAVRRLHHTACGAAIHRQTLTVEVLEETAMRKQHRSPRSAAQPRCIGEEDGSDGRNTGETDNGEALKLHT